MILKAVRQVTAIGLALGVSSALGQGLETMDSQKTRSIAELLAVQAARIEAPQVKVEADPARAVGLTYKKDGILAIPRKGLNEEEKDGNEKVNVQTGAGLGLLFMTTAFCPIVGGKPANAEMFRSVTVVDRQGTEHTVTCLLLAVRRISDENWRLYVYGKGKNPLIDAPFDEARRPNSGPIAIDVEDVSYSDGTLAITVFGKYKAAFRVAYRK